MWKIFSLSLSITPGCEGVCTPDDDPSPILASFNYYKVDHERSIVNMVNSRRISCDGFGRGDTEGDGGVIVCSLIMNDRLPNAEPQSGEPIFALDIDPNDPQIPPVDNPEEVARFAVAAEQLKNPGFAMHVHDSLGSEPTQQEWEEYSYHVGKTKVRFNEISVGETPVPIAEIYTTSERLGTEIDFVNRWRAGDPGSFYPHSLLQRDMNNRIRMLDYKRLGFRDVYPSIMETMNMFTPEGRRKALEMLQYGAQWLAAVQPYGLPIDVFPKGFLVPGGSSPDVHSYRTYDYGMFADDEQQQFRNIWLNREEGDIGLINGVFSWFPLARHYDRPKTFVSDNNLFQSGLQAGIDRAVSIGSHAEVEEAVSDALRWYKEHPQLDFSTSARHLTSIDAAAAIADHLATDVPFQEYQERLFREAREIDDLEYFLQNGVVKIPEWQSLVSWYVDSLAIGPIAGRLRCSMRDARTLVAHIPKDLAKGIVNNFFPS